MKIFDDVREFHKRMGYYPYHDRDKFPGDLSTPVARQRCKVIREEHQEFQAAIAAAPCRRCSECVGQSHHWLEELREDEYGEVVEPEEPVWACRHCEFVMPCEVDSESDDPESAFRALGNLVAAQLHEGIDLIYTFLGRFVELGVEPEQVAAAWDAVHAANMAKEAPSTPHDKPGKPEGWEAPDVALAIHVSEEVST